MDLFTVCMVSLNELNGPAGAGFESRVEEYPADASGIRTQVEYRVNPTTGKREKVGYAL